MRSLVAVSICAALLQSQSSSPAQAPAAEDPVKTLVGRLDLEKYKATIKGLTQFGDRRQGTQRNRDAVNWIQKQLESYGYTNAERITYDPPVPTRECGPSVPASMVKPPATPAGAGRAGGAGRGGRGANPDSGQGGARIVGNRVRTGVNCDPMAQPDERIRALDSGPIIPGPVDEVYVTKVGSEISQRDVHRRCAHGRPRLQRSRQR